MESRTFILERPYYYKGMTDEDFLYIESNMVNVKPDILNKLLKAEHNLPPRDVRTKQDVFNYLNLDINYTFDINAI